MKQKKPGISLGTILTLCLTAVVTVGSLVAFGKIRGADPDVRMDAQRVISVVNAVIQSEDATEAPEPTVRTVTVTLAPSSAAAAVTGAPASPQPTAAPTPAAMESYSFSLTAGGLLAFQSDVTDSVYDKTNKTANCQPVVSGISAQFYADLNLVFFPQLINTWDRKYGDHLAPGEAAEAIRSLGVDEVILGSEHILDQGAQGAASTVSALNGQGILCGGVNASGARQSHILPLNGGSVALLCYTDAWTANGKNALREDGSLLNLYQEETARQEIAAARSQGAQCVIVCLYWGKADAVSVTNAQRTTAHILAEMGADVILGARASRVLPMEKIACVGEDGRAREAFVAYSLGTLLTESREGYDISGALLHLKIDVDAQGVRVSSAQYTPTYIWRQSAEGKYRYRVVCSADPAPEDMSAQQREVMQRALNRIQTTLKDSPVSLRP